MLGLFVFVEVLNDIMFEQFDDRMIVLWENQREGLGLVTGWYQHSNLLV